MPIFLVGLNHRTAPIDLREHISLAGDALRMALQDLKVPGRPSPHASDRANSSLMHEAVILSTCNRLEVYTTANDAAGGWTEVERFLAKLSGLSAESIHPHLYFLEGQPVVEHLMRVTAGLDSMILGEPQILGQVATAHVEALAAGTTGPILSHLFARAIHAGKRARGETAISRHTTSVSHAAVQLASDKLNGLSGARVLIVGAGEMAELVALAMHKRGAQTITCINRTHARAQRLAGRFQGRALSWHHLPEALVEADVVVSATGAPHTVICYDDVAQVLPRRHGRPLFFVDIAVPRDVEVAVGELPDVYRYDIDQLQFTVDANLELRQAAVPQVKAILAQEIGDFLQWLNSRQAVPVLVELRRKAETMARAEVEHALRRLEHPDPRVEQTISLLAHRIVNKLLHEPTVRLKSHAANGDGVAYAQAVLDLFALDGENPERLQSGPNGAADDD